MRDMDAEIKSIRRGLTTQNYPFNRTLCKEVLPGVCMKTGASLSFVNYIVYRYFFTISPMKGAPEMFTLPVYVGIDYHTNTLQICVMNQQRKILANQSVENDPEAVFKIVAIYGSNVHVALEACTGV